MARGSFLSASPPQCQAPGAGRPHFLAEVAALGGPEATCDGRPPMEGVREAGLAANALTPGGSGGGGGPVTGKFLPEARKDGTPAAPIGRAGLEILDQTECFYVILYMS